VIAYGRGERERTTWEHKNRFEERTAPPQRVVISQVGDPDAPYIREIDQLEHENTKIQREIDQLKREIAGFKQGQDDYGLDDSHLFGERMFKCEIDAPGVGYRNTPSFADKNPDGTGPQAPEVIKADRICQGPAAVFVRCMSGKGWLPLSDPTGKRVCFTYIGKANEVDLKLKGLEMAKHEDKLSPKKDQWFTPNQD
jgi:hypothetical protein